MKRFKKISIALMSAVLTVWFCGILEGISVFADTGTANMEIEVSVTPDGLLEMNTELTFTIDIVGAGTAPYDYEIEYGDDGTESHSTSALSHSFKHTYAAAGSYTVTALSMDAESEWGVVEFEYDVAEEAPSQCADLLDNDGDGLEDYPLDPGCTSIDDNDEYNAPIDDGTGDGDTGDGDGGDGSGDGDTGDGDGSGDSGSGLQFYDNLDDFFDDTNGTGQPMSDTNDTGTTGNTGTNQTNTNTNNTLDQGTLGQTPDSQAQMQATLALQNSTTGQSAGTGPEALIYLVFPGLALVINRFRNLE